MAHKSTERTSEKPPTIGFPEAPPNKMISRSIGEELRRTREQLGWSRRHLVSKLPSGIGDRTLLSYEHGSRDLSVLRLLELGWAMETDPPRLLTYSLQRAHIKLENLNLIVDLNALLRDQNERFRPMIQWARNVLNTNPSGIVEVEPAVVRHLALFVGCRYPDLTNHLCRFTPDCD